MNHRPAAPVTAPHLSGRATAATFLLGLVVPTLALVGWLLGADALGAPLDVLALCVPVFAIVSALLLWLVPVRRMGVDGQALGLVRPARSLWHLLWVWPLITVVCALIAASLGHLLHLSSPARSSGSRFAASLPVLVLIGATTSLVVPFLEEVVFRGAIFGWARERWGALSAVAISGVLFGLAHVSPTLMLYLLPLGLCLSLARAWFRSTWASIGLHVLNNSMLTILTATALSS